MPSDLHVCHPPSGRRCESSPYTTSLSYTGPMVTLLDQEDDMTGTVTPIRASRKLAWRTTAAEVGTLTSFLAGYETHLRAKGQAEKTIEKKILALSQLAAFLGDPDVSVVERSHLEAFMVARLATVERSSAAT